ncbi:CpsD/CapB family tyrosine-protein kinase [Sulfitobacter noctilucae]|uniref:CpsD/CapB family tyrosine-protein kinase n=1 Tax=Sulfitobacter noctilucae TaxID=1342302 RepID=UPI00046941F2|nr:CpsD/CapB family tyrosine-protein kinase [Sulfitobacter noctilucae]
MRDLYAEDDLRAAVTGVAPDHGTDGMRHSIRPRRALVAEPARRSLQPETDPATDTVIEHAAAPIVAPTGIRYRPDSEMPRWQDLAHIEAGSRRNSETDLPVVDSERDSASVRAFDLLRTRLRQTTQEHGWVNIAVTAPTGGCGNTFTAVNLALSLSRVQGSRTVLMDLNLRKPGVAKTFDVTPQGAMRDFMAGRTPIGDHMVKISDTLALGLNDASYADAAETLQADETAHTLERMRAALQPELVIYDMPPMLAYDDVSAFLPHLDGVLMVSDGTRTMARELMECERMLEGQVPLLGVVLNRARANSIKHYA